MKRTAPRRGDIVAALDIGSSKIACLIARVDERGPHVIGIGHQLSRGVRHGVIVDLDAASRAIGTAVQAAESMAGEQVEHVVVGIAGGFASSRIVPVEIPIERGAVSDADMHRALRHGLAHREPDDRLVIHSIPVGFSIDGREAVRDPRGMITSRLGINMHVVSANGTAIRNVIAALGRCHLEQLATVAGPYAAGLAVLTEDELELGAIVVDMGGGATSIAVFYDGAIVHADSIPVGGQSVTNDIARGFSTPIAAAERLKVLHAGAIPHPADEREPIRVPSIGEDDSHITTVPKSHLIGIVRPRIEETLELVRDRLEVAGFGKARRDTPVVADRVVLTGGASQLTGVRELAHMFLDKKVRLGEPRSVAGLAQSTQGPAFAATAGLLRFACSEAIEWQPQDDEPDKPIRPRPMRERIGGWFRRASQNDRSTPSAGAAARVFTRRTI